MSFEQEANEYLYSLITGGTILSGDLIGVSEIQSVCKAIVGFIINGGVKEKNIILKKENNNWTWYFISILDQNEINKTTDDWCYPNFSKRIVAPSNLIMDDIGIKMYGWFQINNLPVENVGNFVHLYCNTILPEHNTIIQNLEGLIQIQDIENV